MSITGKFLVRKAVEPVFDVVKAVITLEVGERLVCSCLMKRAECFDRVNKGRDFL